MSLRLPSRVTATLATSMATSLAAVMLLGGCGNDEPTKEPGGKTTAPVTEPTTEATSELTTEPAATASDTSPASTADLKTRLLSARALPGVNEATRWKVSSTEAEKGAGHGTCQKFSLVDIGAESSLVRSYAGGTDLTAVQVVAEFADAKSAWRAHQVVRTWASSCADMLDAEVEKVGKLTPVPVPSGVAQQQLLQYGDKNADAHTFAGVAITRRDNYLSIVQIELIGQDYNYEPGQEPAAQAAVAANQKLG
jgi:hypothetical protein